MLRLKRAYEQSVEARNHAGIQLIDRNDELCVLYEKSNVQQATLRAGTVALEARAGEARMVRVSIAELQRQIQVTRAVVPEMPDLAERVIRLQQELAAAREVSGARERVWGADGDAGARGRGSGGTSARQPGARRRDKGGTRRRRRALIPATRGLIFSSTRFPARPTPRADNGAALPQPREPGQPGAVAAAARRGSLRGAAVGQGGRAAGPARGGQAGAGREGAGAGGGARATAVRAQASGLARRRPPASHAHARRSPRSAASCAPRPKPGARTRCAWRRRLARSRARSAR